jgi:hypothetical protein
MAVKDGFGWRRWSMLAITGLALAAAVLRPAEALWWLVRLAGGGAVLAMAWAALVTPRSADRTSRTYRHHQWTGRIGLALAVLHAGLIAAGEPQIWRYAGLLATAELVAGATSLALLVLLTAIRDPASPVMWTGAAAPTVHRWAAVAAIVLGLGHIAANPAMPLAAFVLLAVAAALLVRSHAAALVAMVGRAPLGILAGVVAALLLVAVAGWGLSQASQRALRESPVDHAGFDHDDHAAYSCVSCHHNFTDRTGKENCLNCHKRLSVSSTTRIDRVFHRFCVACHVEEWWRTAKPSPFKSCNGCHGDG